MKKALCFLLLLSATGLNNLFFGQSLVREKHVIKSVNGDLHINPNGPDFTAVLQNVNEELFEGNLYRLIQFYEIPTQTEKEELATSGIILFDYLPYHTFYAAIPANINPDKLQQFNIRAISPITKELKLSKALYTKEYPAWAIKENNEIEIIVGCFKNISLAQALTQLNKYNVMIVGVDKHINAITIRTNVNNIDALTNVAFINFIEPIHPPGEPENLPGRSSHRSNMIASDYATGRHYTGAGVNVAMLDDGIIGPHIDYQGRIGAQHTTSNGGVEHGDHVSGIIMGAGNLNPRARGMGFGSTLYVYDAAPSYSGFDSIYNHYNNPGIVITSTSYSDGCNAGYTSFSQKLDNQLRTMPSLNHVFSAGNTGTSNCAYGAGAGWGNISGGHKLAKNAITVANLDSVELVNISSSRGPATDGRIKPDVSAIGTAVLSTMPDNNYLAQTGTSMSCPGVSGTLSQLYEAYKTHNSGNNPEGGLMKAVLMNGCDDLGNAGPDFIYGYGRINALNSAKTIEAGNYITSTIAQGNTSTHNIVVPAGTKQLRVMLYWTDYESSPTAGISLVNDLNVQVIAPGAISYNPWVLDHTPNAVNLNMPATRGIDNRNNAEQVTIDNPVSGTYTISVNGLAVPQGPQKYFITYMFVDENITLTYPNGGEGFVPGEQEIIRWDAYGNTGTFTLEYSTDNGSSWNNISSAITSSSRHYLWTVPSVVTGQALVRISRGAFNDVSDAKFTIVNVPQNLAVAWVCPDSLQLTWSSVTGATGYEVSKLGNMYMDSVGTSTTTSIVLYNLNPLSEYWFSVKALTTNSGEGRRALAIKKSSGVSNCLISNDASVASFTSPATGHLPSCQQLNSLPVKIKIKNLGINNISSIPVHYSINGGTPVNEIYTNTLTPGDSAIHTFASTINLSASGTYTFYAWASYTSDGNFYNDSAIAIMYVPTSSSLQTLPYSQNFETFTSCSRNSNCEADVCTLSSGWVNETNLSGDDIDWRTSSGTTPTNNTGPSIDHNPGTSTGNYLYLESSGCFGKTGHLLSPCFDLRTMLTAQLSFWYHMNGSTMGNLHVDAMVDGIWTTDIIPPYVGHKGFNWIQSTANLNAFVGKIVTIRFRGITGSSFYSDMALDDISITGTVGIKDENDISNNVIVYPNPGKNIFNISMLQLSGNTQIIISDVEGRTVYSQTINNMGNYQGTIDLSALSDGVYFMNVNTEGKSCNKKIIKASY